MTARVYSPLFLAIFNVLIGEEGGYTNDPQDPGGETNWGIDRASHPTVNIKALSKADAQAIYHDTYWVFQAAQPGLEAVTGDTIGNPTLALMVFDAAVNNGPERARDWLQLALGVTADGYVGPQTLTALKAATATPKDSTAVAWEFLARRIDFMGGLKTWQTFGLGWSRRLAALPFKAAQLPN